MTQTNRAPQKLCRRASRLDHVRGDRWDTFLFSYGLTMRIWLPWVEPPTRSWSSQGDTYDYLALGMTHQGTLFDKYWVTSLGPAGELKPICYVVGTLTPAILTRHLTANTCPQSDIEGRLLAAPIINTDNIFEA